MDFAAGNGYLEIVEWLHKNRKEGCTTDAMDFAAKYGKFEIVEYLRMLEAIRIFQIKSERKYKIL
jgi:hypothetical protein